MDLVDILKEIGWFSLCLRCIDLKVDWQFGVSFPLSCCKVGGGLVLDMAL